MSLHFTLHVNGESISEGVTITRIGPGQPVPDDVNRYVVQANCDGRWLSAAFEHRYGDGPWELVWKALKAMRGADG